MKIKTSYLTTPLLCLCMAVFVSCQKKAEEDTMEEQKQMVVDELTSLYQGNIDKFIKNADYADYDLNDSVRYNVVRTTLAAFVSQITSNNGGFDHIEATFAERTSDSTAFIYYDMYYKNGDVHSLSQKIMLHGNKWQLRVKE